MNRIDQNPVYPRMHGRPKGVAIARRLIAAACAALFAVDLGGCSGLGEMSISSTLVTRGKYDMFSCQDLGTEIRNRRTRQADLEKLMAQASQGTGGALVSAMAYRSDYTQNRGEIDELVRTADSKQCKGQSEWSSVRAVF